MNKAFFLILFSFSLSLSAQSVLNMELFGQYHRGDSRYSGSWAYIDDQGNEYALLGARTGTAAYGIDALDIEELGFVSGPESNWREITVFGHYAYITTEGNTDSTGLQIIDLQYLPDSLHLVNTYTETFTRGHILQRDIYSDSAYIYVNGTPETDGTHILDISDPENPVEVGLYAPGYYIHDCFVKGDLLFAAAFYEATMDIVDISDKANPELILRLDHFDGNTHSSWVTEDDRYLFIASELDGKPARIYNIEDLNNIDEVALYTANFESLVHNPYIRGEYAFVSHNTEGIRVVDLHDPEVPVEVGHYDTWDGDSGGFHGLWSACPYFPSGKIIGGNREDGLYIWSFNNAKAGRIYATVRDSITQEIFSNLEVQVLEPNVFLETNFDGLIKYGALPGTYTFLIEQPGYLPEVVEFDLEGCDSLVMDILLNPEMTEGIFNIPDDVPHFVIAPNPTDTDVQIDLSDFENAVSVEIYNTVGKRCLEKDVSAERTTCALKTGAFASGLYFILLRDANGNMIGRSRLLRL